MDVFYLRFLGILNTLLSHRDDDRHHSLPSVEGFFFSFIIIKQKYNKFTEQIGIQLTFKL